MTEQIGPTKSIWTSSELMIAVGTGAAAATVTAVVLHVLRAHQALQAKPPFLRSQGLTLCQAIEALPAQEQVLLQAVCEARVMGCAHELQLAALELTGPQACWWSPEQWLEWLQSDHPLSAQVDQLCHAGRHMLDRERLARMWSQTGSHEALVQLGGALKALAPKESAGWSVERWLEWFGQGHADQLLADLRLAGAQEYERMISDLAIVTFIRSQREAYATLVAAARRAVGPQWANWTAEQWSAYLQQAAKSYYHPLHGALRPFIDPDSPFYGLVPDSPLACRADAKQFYELLAGQLCAQRGPVPLGYLEFELQRWKALAAAWLEELSANGLGILEKISG